MPGSAHRAAWSDSAAEPADSATLDAEPQAQRLARSEPSAPKEFWEHRPCPPEEAVSVPIKSGQAAAEASASQESPRLWEQTSAELEQGSKVQALPEWDSEAPAHEQPEQPVQAQEEPAQHAAAPDAASESTAAKNGRPLPLTKADAEAAPDARAAPELLPFSFAASLSRSGHRSPRPESPREAPQACEPAARERAPPPEHSPRSRDGAKFQAQIRRQPRRSPSGGPAKLRRRRASWSASSCRQYPAPPTSQESRWA